MSRPVFQPQKPQRGKRATTKYRSKTFPGSEYTPEQVEWLRAIIRWKAMHDWNGRLQVEDARRVLLIARCLGYRRMQ